jgi:hypothetical protein
MTWKELNLNPSDREVRTFSVLWLLAFGLFGGLAAWRGSGSAPAFLGVALAGGLIGLALPQLMRRVYVVWMIAAFPIGWTISLVLQAVVFYAVLTPIGVALRMAGRDPLGRRFDRNATTYWVTRRRRDDVDGYFRQF